MSTDDVRLGTPITTEQACRAILRLIDSPIIGDVNLDRDAGSTIARLTQVDPDLGTSPYGCLSSGEQRLVTIAKDIWQARDEGLGAIGGLDRDNRRKVLMALAYLHLGRDSTHLLEADPAEFGALFGGPR